MRITTTVKNKDDIELIAYSHWCLSNFIDLQYKECAYSHNNMQVLIVRKKNENISVKGYRV